jgi:hypothetical protein
MAIPGSTQQGGLTAPAGSTFLKNASGGTELVPIQNIVNNGTEVDINGGTYALSPTGVIESSSFAYIPGGPGTTANPSLAPTPPASTLPSAGNVGSVPSSPAPLIAPSSTALNTASPPGVTTTSPITTPVTTSGVPASASSPTTTTPTCNALLQNVLNALGAGTNTYSSGSGGGVGADDTSLPSPTTADVEALQPTAAPTSSSGPSVVLIIGIIAVAGIGIYLWYRSKKGAAE